MFANRPKFSALSTQHSALPFPLPASLGYSMPPEWHPHAATWLAWPHNRSDWPGKFAPIPWLFADIVRLLAQAEHVNILIQSPAAKPAIQSILQKTNVNLKNVSLIPQPTDRIWTRDSGPIFLTKATRHKGTKALSNTPASPPLSASVPQCLSALALADFKFNAWAKYDNSKNDDRLPAAIAKRLGLPIFTAYGQNNSNEFQRFVLEGGSIDVNGDGCLLTTEECLLSKTQQRNPNFSRQRIEQTLASYLGIQKVLWLNRGILGDDTHGHIDDLARFTNPTTILTAIEPNKHDPNHAPLNQNLQRLKQMRDTHQKPFTIIELPLPAPVLFAGDRLPASYANFYIANVGVLVPTFHDPNDTPALRILEQAFPTKQIIPVYSRDLVLGLGTLHCLTQQQPAVPA